MSAIAEEEDWVMNEIVGVSLEDARRTKHLMQIVRDLSCQPTASFPQACGTTGALKAGYRFVDTPSLEAKDVIESHLRATHGRYSTLGYLSPCGFVRLKRAS